MTGSPQPGAPMDRPVFIGGCMRSGTTLLMQMLDCSAHIAFPAYETYFMANFYGSLAIRKAGAVAPEPGACLPQMARLAHGSFSGFCESPWVRGQASGARTYAEAFDAACREMAARVGKPRWGDKTPGNEFFAADILELFPSSVFLYVLRDYRDVIVSKRDRALDGSKSRWAETMRGAWLWRASLCAHRWNLAHLDARRYREVRYEDLVTDPSAMLSALSAPLEEDLSGIVERREGGFSFRQLGQGSHSQREGRSNTTYADQAPAPGEVTASAVGRHRARLSLLESVAAGFICRAAGAAPHPPTSHRSFGKREHRLAYRRSAKAKFWFGQAGRRITDPVESPAAVQGA